MDINKSELPESMFLPLSHSDEVETLAPPQGKGYLLDALSRALGLVSFRISAIIILVIALFSILAPLFISRSDRLMDPYYAKLPPRLSRTVSSGVERRLGDEGLLRLMGIAIAASGNTDNSYLEVNGSDYDPILSLGDDEGRVRSVRVDPYLEVGFVYRIIDKAEYTKILEWERENGGQILYPLIARNELCPDINDANMWYKVEGGEALLGDEKVSPGYGITANNADIRLVDNYLRDEAGNYAFSAPSGPGANPESLRVRVLYYNYYRFKTGAAPSYLFGTDSQGYDLALRVAGGIRVSLLLGIAVSLLNLIIGAVIGAIEGYYGGIVDLSLERLTDILSGVPFIVVATLFQIYLSDRVGAIPSLLFAFVLTGWLGTANRVRAQFYRYKGAEYVLAARNMGVSDFRIITRHIFPNTLGTLITASALVIPGVIFTESMLSFLGIVNLGSEGVTSLGTLLSDASGIWVNHPHLMLVPAFIISLLMIAFNLLGNALREAFNPGLKGGS